MTDLLVGLRCPAVFAAGSFAADKDKVTHGMSFVKWIVVIHTIHRMDIRALNLNLLVVLDALLAERHVSRAARRLHLSQPAVSNALRQLRELLADPLLVRGRDGMVPTDRALALADPLRATLENLAGLLGSPAFDPARAERTFVIATSDFVEFVLMPKVLARLSREAPGIRLQLQAWQHHNVPPTLATGEADLMVGFSRLLPGHREQILFPDDFVCVVRRNHPKVKERLSLKTYIGLQHVLVTSQASGPGLVDEALAKRGLSRTIALRMSHFLMVPPIIAVTDYVAAISPRVAAVYAGPLGLRVLTPPLPLPRGNVTQVWHERTHNSLAHQYLRGLFAEVAQEV
jgi:DNA-binding transcriptional LysR family regulator